MRHHPRQAAPTPRPRDRRALGILLTAAAVLLGGLAIGRMEPTHPVETIERPVADPQRDPTGHAELARQTEVRRSFDAAVRMLQASRYEPAVAALRRVLELAPGMPEAHANMGFAMLGLQRASVARDYFAQATTLNANQANAYYGLALAHEARGELDLALGAMRTYLHLARAEDEAHLRRARAALWEWETQLAARRAAARP